VTGVWI